MSNLTKRQRRRRAFFRIAAMATGLFIATGIGEVTIRLCFPDRLNVNSRERDLFCRFDAELGWVPLENVTAVHKKDFSVTVHQNQFGLRGPDDMQTARTSGKRRVLVLGDSYIWGFGANQKALFSAGEVHGTNEEILNFGVSGYGTDQEYLFYLREGAKFAVDEVVVALTPYNDLANNLASKQYGYLKPYFTLENGQLALHNQHVHNSGLRIALISLNRHSRVCNLITESVLTVNYWFKSRRGSAQATKAAYKPQDVTEEDRRGVALTVEILKKLRDAVVAQNAEFSVVFIPYSRHIGKRLTENHPLVPLIAESLTRGGIAYREPYPEFLKAARAGVHCFNDPDNHFGTNGHALFAKFVTRTEQAAESINYYSRQHTNLATDEHR